MCFMMFIGLQGHGYHWSIAIADWSAKEASRATWGKISYYEISFLWSPKSCWKSPRGWEMERISIPCSTRIYSLLPLCFCSFRESCGCRLKNRGGICKWCGRRRGGSREKILRLLHPLLRMILLHVPFSLLPGMRKWGHPIKILPERWLTLQTWRMTVLQVQVESIKCKRQQQSMKKKGLLPSEEPPTGPKSDWLGWAAASDSRSWTVDNAFPASVGDGN